MYTYQTIEGIPDASTLDLLLETYTALFEDAKLDFFVDRIHSKDDLIINICYQHTTLIGFKIGYRYDENTFYSWIGGVLATRNCSKIDGTSA